MASSRKILVTGKEKPVHATGSLSPGTAELVTKLMQENHDKYHIFFTPGGLHNHIAHYQLTLFALNDTPAQIQAQYDRNQPDQRHIGDINQTLFDSLLNADAHHQAFHDALNKEENYATFLEFFHCELESKGVAVVLQEYLFKGDERADDLLARTFGGFLHPLIHLGFGLEFDQPAVVAEALAQGALHSDYLKPYFLACETAAGRNAGLRNGSTLFELLDQIKADEKLSTAAHWDDGNKIRDGILIRAPDEMIEVASRWCVPTDANEATVRAKCAEMYNAVVYYTAAAQHPPKVAKLDFYYMHCVNASIFFPAFLRQPASVIPDQVKIRLLNWKAWNDLCMYASRRSPTLHMSEIVEYGSKHSKQPDDWNTIVKRVCDFKDDGHASKLVRAIQAGEEYCAGVEGMKIQGDLWRKIGNLAIDSVEAGKPESNTWVRSAGFEEAWEKFPVREAHL